MIEFYVSRVLTLFATEEKKKSCFDKNRTHDFRTNRCAGYLLDHSGDEGQFVLISCLFCVLLTVVRENGVLHRIF